MGKVGYHLPRTISSAIISRENDDPEPFRIRDRERYEEVQLRQRYRSRDVIRNDPQGAVFRIGGSVIPPRQDAVDNEITQHSMPPHNQPDASPHDRGQDRRCVSTDKTA